MQLILNFWQYISQDLMGHFEWCSLIKENVFLINIWRNFVKVMPTFVVSAASADGPLVGATNTLLRHLKAQWLPWWAFENNDIQFYFSKIATVTILIALIIRQIIWYPAFINGIIYTHIFQIDWLMYKDTASPLLMCWRFFSLMLSFQIALSIYKLVFSPSHKL